MIKVKYGSEMEVFTIQNICAQCDEMHQIITHVQIKLWKPVFCFIPESLGTHKW